MHEARALAQISHPNIVHIFSLGPPDELPHFVMELVEGRSLVEAARALTLSQKAELMRKVALAVHFLHEHNIVHRDLKPTNILVNADLEPKILDFGLAQHVGRVTRLVSLPRCCANPKSKIFGSRSARTNMFVGFRSRCTIWCS